MTRRDVFGVLAVFTTVVGFAYVVEHFAWLAWVVLAGMALFVIFTPVVLALTSRDRSVSPPPCPGASSGPIAGGPGRTHRPGGSARSRPRRDDGLPLSKGQWF